MQQSRVRPVEPRCRVARGDVLVNAIERVLERAAPGVPGGQELLVGAPPEQPRAIPAHPLAHLGDGRLVAVRDPPAAERKPIPRVLVRAAWSLHHAVKRHPIHHDYLSHLISSSSPISSPVLLPSHLLFFSLGAPPTCATGGFARPQGYSGFSPLHERDRPKSTPPPKSPTRAPCTAAFPRGHVFSGRSRAFTSGRSCGARSSKVRSKCTRS